MADNPMLLHGLLAGAGASIACGLIGPYVLSRRIVFLSGAIAHTAIGGVGAAVFLAAMLPGTFGWCSPVVGAAVVALLAAVVLAVLHERVTDGLDTLIGAMWAIGMSVGILLMNFTPGYQVELMSYLFGSIAYVSTADLWLIGALDIVIVLTVLLYHKRFMAVCLDREQAELQGVNVLAANMVLLCLVALTVVCLIRVVGLILVLALLTLPAATAGHHARRLGTMMLTTTVLCLLLTTLPRVAVYGLTINGRGFSPESAIVIAAGILYLGSVMFRRLRSR
jgi:zinc transport system permease protein